MPWISKRELRELTSQAHWAKRAEQDADRERQRSIGARDYLERYNADLRRENRRLRHQMRTLSVVKEVVSDGEGVLAALEKADQIMGLVWIHMSLRASKIVEALGQPEVVEVALRGLVDSGHLDFTIDTVLDEKIYCPTRTGLREIA